MFAQAHMPKIAALFVDAALSQRSIPVRPDEGTRLADLVARLADGDEGALSEFYTATVGHAYALALHLRGDALGAESAIEEAYVCAWHAARKLAPTGHALAWLLTHVREAASAASAASAGACARLPDLLALTAPASAVHQALQRLGETQQQAICAALLHGGDIEMTASALAVASRTAKARLRAGVKALAAQLHACAPAACAGF